MHAGKVHCISADQVGDIVLIKIVPSHLEYPPDTPIEELVRDTVMAYHRGPDKEREWLAKLKNQDIMTVGDLKDLQDSDWAGFDLTVFASRAIRNRLFGKSSNKRPSPMSRSPSGTDDGN